MKKPENKAALFIVAIVLTPCAVVHANPLQNALAGLGMTGFELSASRNPLSGGLDATLFNNFAGTPLDFGAGDITFSGPVSLAVSTGGRLMPTLDISLSTAVSADTAPSNLSYLFNYDPGSQAIQVAGNLFIDADFSMNRLGFYDVAVTYSSRQTVTRDGRFANDEANNDFDYGPISVSGNIFADVLAAATQPFFDQTGSSNPFANFSGSAKLAEMARAFEDDSLDVNAADVSLASSLGVGVENAFTAARPIAEAPVGNVVPEPTVLVLLLAGLPAVFRRSRFAL